MTELARGFILPDLFVPDPADLLSLLLVWDELEVEDRDGAPGLPEYSEFRDKLRESGLVREYPTPYKLVPIEDPSLPGQWTDEVRQKVIEEDGQAAASAIFDMITKAQAKAAEHGLAPIATTQLAELASLLPPPAPRAPVAEATMIRVAVNGMRLAPGTAVEDVLRFRDRNGNLMGRFRAAMIDLSAAIDSSSPAAATEQAHALMANRVEPLLGDLTIALDRGRLSYFANTLFGLTSLALVPADPVTKVVSGGGLVSRSVRYPFDRERVIREHPFGLVYRRRQDFEQRSSNRTPAVITDPAADLAALCSKLVENVHRSLRSDQ